MSLACHSTNRIDGRILQAASTYNKDENQRYSNLSFVKMETMYDMFYTKLHKAL